MNKKHSCKKNYDDNLVLSLLFSLGAAPESVQEPFQVVVETVL